MRHCGPECPFCARAFFKWYKTRMAQMRIPRKGERVSFAEAAATSIVVPEKKD